MKTICIFVVLLLSAGPVLSQEEQPSPGLTIPHELGDVTKRKLNENFSFLLEKIERLKAEVAQLRARQGVEAHAAWIPLQDPVVIGDLPLLSRQVTAFEFPAELPAIAREVLIYVKIFSGNNGPSLANDFVLYTQEGDKKYAQLLHWSRYPQDAVGFNSENLWFPVTGERKIYVRLDGTPGNRNSSGKIHVLGYRE